MGELWKSAAVRERLSAGLLLLLLAGELGWGIRSDGLTIDELVYIGSGYRQLTAGDFRLNPEQPPLAKLFGAVPLAALPLRLPASADATDEWGWSYQFVHRANAGAPVIAAARLPSAFLTLVLASLLWAWARSLYGSAAAMLALTLIAFHPALLAHGHLNTTDLPGTVTMVLASLAFWRWSRSPTWPRAALVAVVVGMAVSTRLTGWLLLPSFALLWGLSWIRTRGRDRLAGLAEGGQLAAACGVVIPLLIWAAYGFRYAPFAGASVAKVPGPELGMAGRLIAILETAHALPEAYLEGARFVAEHNAFGHPTYLLGQNSITGWPYYYVVAFLVKNTPGFLLAVAATLALLWRRRREIAAGSIEAHWIVPAAAMFVAASAGHIQIGERYVLPIYPYLILLAASTLPRILAGGRGRAIAALGLALHAGPSLAAAPGGYLAYFNALAGGTRGGHRVLADSNLDWGQDLPRLAAWMRRRGVASIQLGYHGSDDPGRYGIVREDLPGMHLNPGHPPARPFSGTVAVSPNLLLGIFYDPGENPYEALKHRAPDDRAGVYFIYRLEGSGSRP